MTTNPQKKITSADHQGAEGNIDINANLHHHDCGFLRHDTLMQVPTGEPLSSSFDHKGNYTSSNYSTTSVLEQRDGFLYFSDQDTRLNYLMLKAEENQNEGPRSGSNKGLQRKTRLSFEVHDSMIFDGMMPNNLVNSADGNDDPVVDFLQVIVDSDASESTDCQECQQLLLDVLGL
mmetsp:Transcript_15895/g.33137  ORF Transcript_15895/g.33137 Transcript_15895/m.33137 type:complete len:176 (+) Transcript_15895:2-529(+)